MVFFHRTLLLLTKGTQSNVMAQGHLWRTRMLSLDSQPALQGAAFQTCFNHDALWTQSKHTTHAGLNSWSRQDHINPNHSRGVTAEVLPVLL